MATAPGIKPSPQALSMNGEAPSATVIVTAIFPRNDNMAALPTINRVNAALAMFADGKSVRFLNVNDRLADKNGVWFEGMTLDKLHPSLAGYQVWADGLRPILSELLGPPSTTSPSAARSRCGPS